ncbi:MAG TPA: response regulator transcription factor [Burkholderiaceae bacterium]|jgi:DNA-binding NarL/FixJ family response regulator|nr:response regulator transcription factor [Burkholderiaceae bacterium]
MPQQESLKVLVVDDHASIRAGIAGLIDLESPCMHCVGSAATAREALLRTQELLPDVIVLDVDLAGEDGLALIPALRRSAHCEVVVFTCLTDPQINVRARRLGAHACISKTSPTALLMTALRSAGRSGPTPPNAGSGTSPPHGTNRP